MRRAVAVASPAGEVAALRGRPGEQAVGAGEQEILAAVVGRRLAEVRRARGLAQQQVADRMGITKGRVSQIE